MLLRISPRLVILRNWFSCSISVIVITRVIILYLSSSMEVSNLLIDKESVRYPDLLDIICTNN